MIKYYCNKLFSMAIVLIVVTTITFFVSRLLPGDPTSLWVGDRPTKEQLKTAKKDLGFDRPIYEQYKSYMIGLLKLDLGISLRTRQPVLEEVRKRFFATFELVSVSMFFAVSFGFLLGLFSAIKQNSGYDKLISGIGYIGLSFPLFWLGMILQLIFFGFLKWFPLQGRSSGFEGVDLDSFASTGILLIDSLLVGNVGLFANALMHITLPALTMVFGVFGLILRTTRSSIIETSQEPFFKTYLAYGVSRKKTIWLTAFKNTLIPVTTVSGLSFGLLLGGTFLVESIFDWPGLGQFSVMSILSNDFPAIMGVTLLYTTTYVLINLLIDLLYPLIDPRIRKINV